MSQHIILHLENRDPILAELESPPPPSATNILIKNPRSRDGKAVPWIGQGATALYIPMNRITYIEVLVGRGEDDDLDMHIRTRSLT